MPLGEPLTANSVVRVWTSRVAVGTERDAAIVRALHRQDAWFAPLRVSLNIQ